MLQTWMNGYSSCFFFFLPTAVDELVEVGDAEVPVLWEQEDPDRVAVHATNPQGLIIF